MPTLAADSPAKINLTLAVRGVRPDGYHEIDSLVARVTLADRVTITDRADGQINVDCDDPSLPRDAGNLAVRAALRLRERLGQPQLGADIRLEKRIPAGAGLGGGSSNAACTLRLLNRLWRVELGDQGLAELGAALGADVPLFFQPPLCTLRGRGDEVAPAECRLRLHVVLILPAIHSPTADVYAVWDRLPRRTARPALGETVARVAAGADAGAAAVLPHLYNDLEDAARANQPELDDFATRLHKFAPATFHMSGSGSAYFTLADTPAEADALERRVSAALGVRTESVAIAVETGVGGRT